MVPQAPFRRIAVEPLAFGIVNFKAIDNEPLVADRAPAWIAQSAAGAAIQNRKTVFWQQTGINEFGDNEAFAP
jgi:hypothetical protein